MNKRIVAAFLTGCMLASFTACNNQNDNKVDPTSRETETQITPDFSEPNQSIASSVATTETESSETATNLTQSGAYTYEAYGYSFVMDINIDDYIFVSEYTGNTCFDLYSLAEDLGWRPHRANGDTSYTLDSDQPVQWYEYDYGDNRIMVFFLAAEGSRNNPLDRRQVNMFGYTFRNYPITNGVAWGYDGDAKGGSLYGYTDFHIPKHSSEIDWLSLAGGPGVTGALSREDAIIVAYLLSAGPQHPGENPIFHSDFINSGYDEFSRGQYNLPY